MKKHRQIAGVFAVHGFSTPLCSSSESFLLGRHFFGDFPRECSREGGPEGDERSRSPVLPRDLEDHFGCVARYRYLVRPVNGTIGPAPVLVSPVHDRKSFTVNMHHSFLPPEMNKNLFQTLACIKIGVNMRRSRPYTRGMLVCVGCRSSFGDNPQESDRASWGCVDTGRQYCYYAPSLIGRFIFVYGKKISHRTKSKEAEVHNAGGQSLFSLWSQTWLHARFRSLPHLL